MYICFHSSAVNLVRIKSYFLSCYYLYSQFPVELDLQNVRPSQCGFLLSGCIWSYLWMSFPFCPNSIFSFVLGHFDPKSCDSYGLCTGFVGRWLVRVRVSWFGVYGFFVCITSFHLLWAIEIQITAIFSHLGATPEEILESDAPVVWIVSCFLAYLGLISD